MKTVRLQQGTDAWLRWRLDGIGGSDIAGILGVSPYEDCTRENVLAEKVAGLIRPPTFAMRRGIKMEVFARLAFEKRFQCRAGPMCIEHGEEPWIRASLDGWMENGIVPQLLEIKAPDWMTHDRILCGMVPDHFTVQVQWQLLASGADIGHLVSTTDNDKFAYADRNAFVVIEADAEKQAELLDAGRAFWDEVREARHER